MKDLSDGRDLILDVATLASMAEVRVEVDRLLLGYPKTRHWANTSIDALVSSAVLILGRDHSENLLDLREIEASFRVLGLKPWILRDYEDLPGRDMIQKLVTMAGCSGAIVVVDTEPSGHLVELPILSILTTPTIILREQGKQSTWMADPMIHRSNVKIIEFDRNNPTSLHHAVGLASVWIEETIHHSAKTLDLRYPWRAEQVEFAREIDSEVGDLPLAPF